MSVPEGWIEGRVHDLLYGLEAGVSVNGDDRPKSSTEKAVLKVSAVSYGYFDETACKVISNGELDRARIHPKAGQIIISRSNTEELVGASAYINKNYDDLFLPDKLWQTVPKPESNMKWLSYVLASKHARYTLSNLATGTSGSMKNITKSELLTLKLLIPPAKEQNKIARILSTWDQSIEVTEKLLNNSQQQKKALMQQLLTGKKRLPGFSGEWQWCKSNEIFKTVSKKNNNDAEELLAVTQNQGVLPRSIFERRVVMPEGSTAGYKLVIPGNFIISLRSFQGGLEYSYYRGLVSPAYTVLEPMREINNEFYKQYFKSYNFIGHLAVAVIGIRDGKQISYDDFSFLKLPYPPINEQQKIASVLSAADKEIEILEQKLGCLRQEKKALMQQLLTGKRRVVP